MSERDGEAGARFAGLLADVEAEGDAVDALVAALTPGQWRSATPAPGWTIAHQIGHLEWTERLVLAAIDDEARFRELAAASPSTTPDIAPDALARGDIGAVRLAAWRESRGALLDAFRASDPKARMPWFGPPMSVATAMTARVMELWAHGQDIADAIGVQREATPRLRHVAHLAIAARDYSFRNRGLEPPAVPFRVEITAPDVAGGSGAAGAGATGAAEPWTWGPADAPQRVTGDALDFALLATRRAHRDDVGVEAVGDDADRWLDVIQAFAGPPGPNRPPRG
ncbi:MAG: TIGR03084 family metal-binding protein [Pseudoclavibacter sp.]